MQDLTNKILNLMSRVKADIRIIDNNKHLNVYLGVLVQGSNNFLIQLTEQNFSWEI